MKKIAVILFVLAFIGVNNVQAQSFKLGVGGGVTMVQGYEVFDEADMSTGYHFGAKAKLGLPLLPIKFTGQVYYNTFSGSQDLGFGYSADYSSSLLILGAGAEYSLIPGPISPYLGADVFLSSFGKFKVESPIINGEDDGYSRMGLGLGAGLDFKLLPMFDIDAAVKYNMYNLVGKEDGEEDFNAVTVTVNFMFGI
jgi:opacity protein-like surface antigen